MKKLLLFATLLLVSPLAFAQFGASTAKEKPVKASEKNFVAIDEFESLILKAGKYEIIDLRKEQDYLISRLDASKNVPFDAATFADKVSGLDKNKTIFLYSANKADKKATSAAVQMLLDMKFKEVYYMEGGFEAWNKKKKPVYVPSNDSGGF